MVNVASGEDRAIPKDRLWLYDRRMAPLDQKPQSGSEDSARFRTAHWSIVLAAGRRSTAGAPEASRPRTRIDRRSPFPGDILFPPRLGIGQSNHLIQPGISHDDVIVQKHQVFTARKLQPLVDRRRKSKVLGIRNHGDRHSRQVSRAGQVKSGPIGRPVVDGDQLPGRPGVFLEGGKALLGKFKLVPVRNDDR
jgi:hypothetical protein